VHLHFHPYKILMKMGKRAEKSRFRKPKIRKYTRMKKKVTAPWAPAAPIRSDHLGHLLPTAESPRRHPPPSTRPPSPLLCRPGVDILPAWILFVVLGKDPWPFDSWFVLRSTNPLQIHPFTGALTCSCKFSVILILQSLWYMSYRYR
jgi:hypothetical protein